MLPLLSAETLPRHLTALSPAKAAFGPSPQVSVLLASEAGAAQFELVMDVLLAAVAELMGLKESLSPLQQSVMAGELQASCWHYSMDEIALMLYMGASGKLGKSYNKFSIERLNEWIEAYGLLKADAAEQHNRRQVLLPDPAAEKNREALGRKMADLAQGLRRNVGAAVLAPERKPAPVLLTADGSALTTGTYRKGAITYAVAPTYNPAYSDGQTPVWVAVDTVLEDVEVLTAEMAALLVREEVADDAR